VFTLLKLLKKFKPLGFFLGVKTKANKLNINIKLFFRFNIMANKEYYFTIIGFLKV
jgi:hypothetical protein